MKKKITTLIASVLVIILIVADMVYKVYEVCQTEKELLVVDDAGHGEAYYYAPEKYRDTVFEFLEKVEE